MNINKTQIALDLFYKSFEKDMGVGIKMCFDLADEFEDMAIKRYLYNPTHCPNCYSNFEVINLNGQYKTKCDCSDAQANNIKESFLKWWKIVND